MDQEVTEAALVPLERTVESRAHGTIGSREREPILKSRSSGPTSSVGDTTSWTGTVSSSQESSVGASSLDYKDQVRRHADETLVAHTVHATATAETHNPFDSVIFESTVRSSHHDLWSDQSVDDSIDAEANQGGPMDTSAPAGTHRVPRAAPRTDHGPVVQAVVDIGPDYKDQVQSRPSSTPTTSSSGSRRPDRNAVDAGPDYKDQMRPRRSERRAAEEAVVDTGPEYKDQMRHRPQTRALEEAIVDDSGPEYKDQMRHRPQTRASNEAGVNDAGPECKDQMRHRRTPQTSEPRATNEAVADDSGPEYKDQMRHATPSDNNGASPPSHSPLPTFKEQMRPHDLDEPPTRDAAPRDAWPSPDPWPDRVDPPNSRDNPTVAVAQLHQRRPVVVYNAATPVPSDGIVVAEGLGILVDEIYDDPHVPMAATNATPTPTPEPPKEVEPLKPTLWQTYKILGVFLVVVVIGASAVGGICGSGRCGSGRSTASIRPVPPPSPTRVATPTPTTMSPTRAPVFVRGNESYFTSTEELYFVVDAYVDGVYSNDGNGTSISLVELTDQYGAISDWDVSRLTDFSFVFYRGDRLMAFDWASLGTATFFDDDISGWNVSSAVTMEGMFAGAMNFTQDLSSWDTSKVTNMRAMFHSASAFDGNLGNWSVGSVTDFSGMFYGCSLFQGTQISSWDTKAAQDMSYMFWGTTSLAADLNAWSVGNATSFDSMFYGSSFNGDLSAWDTSRVEIMSSMFRNAKSFDGDVSSWDTRRVTTMANMFHGAAGFNGNLTEWDTGQVVDLGYTFSAATVFNGDLPWNISRVTAMVSTFSNAQAFNSDVSSWDTSSCMDMNQMFSQARVFDGDISRWNTAKVLRMSSMFELASAFNGNISQWDVSNLEECSFMFRDADMFNMDVSSWNISKVTVMSSMFQDASDFNQNLCAWGPRLATTANNVVWQNVFLGSSCKVPDTPVSSMNGPWCHVCNSTTSL